MKSKFIALSMAMIAVPAFAAGPSGFDSPSPQAAVVSSVAEVKVKAVDNAVVTLRGKFTELIRDDKYYFTDEKGEKIQVELDDDQNWSHVSKGALFEIQAEVDKEPNKEIELKVLQAKAL